MKGPAGLAVGLLVGVGVLTIAAATARAQAPPTAAAPSIDVKFDGDYGPHMPPDVSKHGHRIDRLIHVVHWFMGILFVGWGAFFVYCLGRFRRRPGHRADSELIHAKPSKYSEVGVAIFEAVLLIGFAIPVWGSVKNDLPTPEQNPVRIRVAAEQFAWNFHYPGPDGVFAKTAPQFVNPATNPLGKDLSDAHGEDDVVSGELHFPVNRPVICEITSKDVIHSFALPVMRVKQDAIPGMRIPVWFEAVKTGNYEVACAQLCGNNHYSMRALMAIHETQADFEKWVESKRPKAFED